MEGRDTCLTFYNVLGELQDPDKPNFCKMDNFMMVMDRVAKMETTRLEGCLIPGPNCVVIDVQRPSWNVLAESFAIIKPKGIELPHRVRMQVASFFLPSNWRPNREMACGYFFGLLMEMIE